MYIYQRCQEAPKEKWSASDTKMLCPGQKTPSSSSHWLWGTQFFRSCLITFFMSCWKGMWKESLIPVLPSQRGLIRGWENFLANQSSIYIGLSFQMIFLSPQTSALLYVPVFVTIYDITAAEHTALSKLWNKSSQEFTTWSTSLHKGCQAEQELRSNVYDFIQLGTWALLTLPLEFRDCAGL